MEMVVLLSQLICQRFVVGLVSTVASPVTVERDRV